jgi:hypothetical protein
MNPSADAWKLIWELLALSVTLSTILLFAYEVSQGRQFAKAQQVATKRWAEAYSESLNELSELQAQKPQPGRKPHK